MDIQFIVGIITIIASMYGMLKFMLKDVHKEVQILEKSHEDHKKELNEFKAEFKNELRVVNSKFDAMSHRLDGLYRVILDRTYGKNIPEELKP